MSIAAVDDDPVYRLTFGKLWQKMAPGTEVYNFSEGEEALGFFRSDDEHVQSIKVILLDLNMPVCDGWNFLDEFQQLDFQGKSDIKVLIVYSSTDEYDTAKAEEYQQIEGYMIKPLNKQQFQKILEFL
jgi:CheY-like chemotaxis protein